jgi:hypothetical protein
LFVVPKKTQQASFPRTQAGRVVRVRPLRRKRWHVSRNEKNVLVLDRPRFRIDGGGWRGPADVLKIDHAVRDHLGIPRRGGRMKQPWAVERPINPRRAQVDLRYDVDVSTPPAGELFLCVENPGSITARVNGMPVSMDADCGWWCDRSQRLFRIDANGLRPGRNELDIACDYGEDHPGLEIVTILGEFGVKLNETRATLVELPGSLRTGDWAQQGLPFYSGAVTYSTRFALARKARERVFVRLPDYRGAVVKIWVNSRVAGTIAWPPNELDITPYLDGEGGQLLGIEVFAHRRNSHGPLHHVSKWPVWTGPAQFTTEGDEWVDRYQLVPCGLLADPVLEVRT